MFLALGFAAALLAPKTAAAQEAGTGDEKVFAPFVSKIRAEASDGLVKISWTDSRDATGPVEIYRSALPLSAGNLDAARLLAEVPYGAESYLDTPPSRGPWYYWVAAKSETGQRYAIVVPYSNASGAPAFAEPREAAAPASAPAKEVPAASPERARPTAPAVAKLSASVKGDSVLLGFEPRPGVTKLVLYRSASRIAKISDLLDAVIVQASDGPSTSFVDYPVPGIGYYYAILAEGDLTAGDAAIAIGANSTATSAEVPLGQSRVGLPAAPSELRSMPLPLLSVEAALASRTAEPPTEAKPLSADAAKAVAELEASAPAPTIRAPKPRVFPQDLQAPGGGEEYTLRSIVQGVFARKQWDEAAKQLAAYLSLSRSPAVEARSRYYLGQAYFFSGRYREALFEFLMVQSQYYAEGQEWIEAIMPRLRS